MKMSDVTYSMRDSTVVQRNHKPSGEREEDSRKRELSDEWVPDVDVERKVLGSEPMFRSNRQKIHRFDLTRLASFIIAAFVIELISPQLCFSHVDRSSNDPVDPTLLTSYF